MPSRRAFTLLELIVVCAIIGVLVALLIPAIMQALVTANTVACASNLRQIGYATNQYLQNNGRAFFPLKTTTADGTLWYFGFESKASAPSGEGHRELDRTRGRLYPYIHSTEGIEVCPAFDYSGAYKPKYEGKWWTYGVNLELLPGSVAGGSSDAIRPPDAARTVVFADAAQVNTFQYPASAAHPLVEEWFYIQPGVRYVQFRHAGQANVLMADWHVESFGPAAGSLDPRLPSAHIGYLDTSVILHKPRAGTGVN
jgi:prepilin-type processing-associated H-X9-DG protein/prepilin-type N-terminal cleavage/methylation domain-containing protein